MHSDLTIVIPAYNCQEYIRAALQSALMCQGAPVLVSDDCSQDGTLDIIRSVACQTDGRITLVNPTSNLGMTHNWQHLMERVATPFCLKLDGDDIICPHYVTAAMERLRKEPEVAACGGAGQVIDQHTYTNSQPLDASFARQDFHGSFQRLAGVDAFEFLLRWAPYPASSATIYRMSAWRAAGGFDASFGWCPDREIWFRLIRIGAVLWTPSPSALRRVHDANITVHYLESGRSLDEQRRLLAKLDRTFQGHREQRLLGRQMLSLAIRHVRRCFFRRRNQQGSASQLLTQSAVLAAKGTWRQLPF